MLETEIDNVSSLRLYENLGFIREKRLFNFYLNGKDCFRLILEIPEEYWVQQGEHVPKDQGGTAPSWSQLPNEQDSLLRNPFQGLHIT